MYFVIRNPVSLINTVFNGFIPKNFADLNLLQLCYDAIKIGDSNGFRPAKFSEDLWVQCSYSIQTSHKTAANNNNFTIQLYLSLDNQILL